MEALQKLIDLKLADASPRAVAAGVRAWLLSPDGENVPLPMDAMEAARGLGLDVLVFEPGSGKRTTVVVDDSRSALVLPPTLSREQVHMASARMVGRLALLERVDAPIVLKDGPADESPEAEWSRRFARELLMPHGDVLVRWASGDSAKRLMKRYGVTFEQLATRLAEMALV